LLRRGGRASAGDGGTAQSSNHSTMRDHSITSSALSSTVGGIARPIAFAVLLLTTSSNFAG
jgi:hypothetical protein